MLPGWSAAAFAKAKAIAIVSATLVAGGVGGAVALRQVAPGSHHPAKHATSDPPRGSAPAPAARPTPSPTAPSPTAPSPRPPNTTRPGATRPGATGPGATRPQSAPPSPRAGSGPDGPTLKTPASDVSPSPRPTEHHVKGPTPVPTKSPRKEGDRHRKHHHHKRHDGGGHDQHGGGGGGG
jgi:hypothetical protein